MSDEWRIADVTNTVAKCATVVFLAYLGFDLGRMRLQNPPPTMVTIESSELAELRRKLAGSDERTTALQKRLDLIEQARQDSSSGQSRADAQIEQQGKQLSSTQQKVSSIERDLGHLRQSLAERSGAAQSQPTLLCGTAVESGSVVLNFAKGFTPPSLSSSHGRIRVPL